MDIAAQQSERAESELANYSDGETDRSRLDIAAQQSERAESVVANYSDGETDRSKLDIAESTAHQLEKAESEVANYSDRDMFESASVNAANVNMQEGEVLAAVSSATHDKLLGTVHAEENEPTLTNTKAPVDESEKWLECWDPSYEQNFYYNETTGESVWDLPYGATITYQEIEPIATTSDEIDTNKPMSVDTAEYSDDDEFNYSNDF